MLAVVEQQQYALGAKWGLDRGHRRRVSFSTCAKYSGDCMWDQRRVGQRREFDEPYSVRKVCDELARGLERQSGLSGAAGPDEGDQPRVAHLLADLRQGLRSADESRQ